MPYVVALPEKYAKQGWVAKIRDRERLEPPHVTVMHKTRKWRWDLRELRFMDLEPNPRLVPREIVGVLRNKHAELVSAWGEKYPENPVESPEED